jgi:hypothetical protein
VEARHSCRGTLRGLDSCNARTQFAFWCGEAECIPPLRSDLVDGCGPGPRLASATPFAATRAAQVSGLGSLRHDFVTGPGPDRARGGCGLDVRRRICNGPHTSRLPLTQARLEELRT